MPFRADPWLHVIAGCMSSGKTDELLRLLRRAEIARRRILLVRPEIDSRTPGEFAESRSKARFPSVLVNPAEPSSVLALARERDADMVGIEEGQFFDEQLVEVVLALRDSGRGDLRGPLPPPPRDRRATRAWRHDGRRGATDARDGRDEWWALARRSRRCPGRLTGRPRLAQAATYSTIPVCSSRQIVVMSWAVIQMASSS